MTDEVGLLGGRLRMRMVAVWSRPALPADGADRCTDLAVLLAGVAALDRHADVPASAG
jgi:hypothetical protein